MSKESKITTAYETLQSVLKRERQAYEFYAKLAGDCWIEGLRNFWKNCGTKRTNTVLDIIQNEQYFITVYNKV